MSLLLLRSFVEVYRRRSISDAARNLDLTQPAVSQHIQALESQVGRALFGRRARGVEPTHVANDLFQQIGDGLDRAEAALAMAKARSANLSGTVHIAGPAEFVTERVAPRLRALTDAGLMVRLRLGGKADIYNMLLGSQGDLGFTASTPSDSRLAFHNVATETLLAVAAPGFAPIGKPDALQEMPVIAYDLDAPLIRTWCAANDLALTDAAPVITAPDLRTIRSLVIAGMGWTVLPDYLCRDALHTGTLVDIAPRAERPQNPLYLVWAKSALRHPRIAFAQQSLIAALADTAV